MVFGMHPLGTGSSATLLPHQKKEIQRRFLTSPRHTMVGAEYKRASASASAPNAASLWKSPFAHLGRRSRLHRLVQALVQGIVKMQQALAAVGRAGAAWSIVRLPSPRIVLTGSGCPGAATKPGRLMSTREVLNSWVPIRAASQEASREMALEKKKCIPCETGKLQPMSEEKAHSLLPEVSGWELKEIDGVLQLHRSWKTKSFVKGLEIMKRVADVAEAEGHHPDLHLVNWNQLSINISTHAVGGLTENDFIVAAKIGALDLTDLVRKPKAPAK